MHCHKACKALPAGESGWGLVQAMLEVAAFPDDAICAISFNFWHRVSRILTSDFSPPNADGAEPDINESGDTDLQGGLVSPSHRSSQLSCMTADQSAQLLIRMQQRASERPLDEIAVFRLHQVLCFATCCSGRSGGQANGWSGPPLPRSIPEPFMQAYEQLVRCLPCLCERLQGHPADDTLSQNFRPLACFSAKIQLRRHCKLTTFWNLSRFHGVVLT